jgi:serine/threonine protein kinase
LSEIPATTHTLCLKLFMKGKRMDGSRYSKGGKEVAFLQANCTSAAFSHPNIVGIHAIGDALPFARDVANRIHTRQFSIMPMVSNGDLYNFANASYLRPMDQDIVRRIIRQLADAVAHLHAQGIAHRDIKAENVMLNDQAQPMLADFGKVRMEDEESARG